MNEALWLALGLVLVLEGIGPLFFPAKWRAMISELAGQPDEILRRVGGCLFVAGAVIAYMMW
ncbi:DUF2065 domain-containing protein [Parasalinivibrio latis]|uniref:DUF2065 domain-containing protein n=1 Tax=Parasalinivibrio latis TaxID=2952610 RepID=UPI0030E0FF07